MASTDNVCSLPMTKAEAKEFIAAEVRAVLEQETASDASVKWDSRYLSIARHVAVWSKDPNAKVGAVVADRRRRVIALGFNGLPVNVEDSAERLDDKDQKNAMVVHAEENAILIAGRGAEGGTAYVYGKPVCPRCAGVLIQAGISRVVAERPQEGTLSHWDKVGRLAVKMLCEAQVRVDFIDPLKATLATAPIFYEPSTDTMSVEIRPGPGGEGEGYGGEDAGLDLVIHYAPDGEPWLWEIEQASQHPEHIAAALAEMRRRFGDAA